MEGRLREAIAGIGYLSCDRRCRRRTDDAEVYQENNEVNDDIQNT